MKHMSALTPTLPLLAASQPAALASAALAPAALAPRHPGLPASQPSGEC